MSGRRGPAGALPVAFVLLLALAGLAAPVLLLSTGGAQAAANYPVLTGTVHGPTTVGTNLKDTYLVDATGGPAVGFNGTQVGILSFTTTVVGLNTTGVQLLPTAGVFTNGTTNLTLTTTNVTQTLTLNIEIKSGYQGTNVSTNVSYTVVVIQPYVLAATLLVDSSLGTIPFHLAVLLDGNPVGSVAVPSLTGHATFQVTFSYVNANLGPGWHTFSISLAQEHGLIVFANGLTSYSQSFFVASAPANNTIWYVTGVVAFVGALFIWLTSVGARRRGRKR